MADTIILKLKAVADMSDVLTNTKSIEQALSKLKLPPDLRKSFTDTFGALEKEVAKYQEIMEKGFSTKADVTALKKSGDEIVRLVKNIETAFGSIDSSELKKLLPEEVINNLKLLKSNLEDAQKVCDSFDGAALKKNLGEALKDAGKHADDFKNKTQDFVTELDRIKTSTLQTLFKNIDLGQLDKANERLAVLKQRINDAFGGADNVPDEIRLIIQIIDNMVNAYADVDKAAENFAQANREAGEAAEEGAKQGVAALKEMGGQAKNVTKSEQEMADGQRQFNHELDSMKGKIQYFFGLNNAINLFKRGIREAFNTIKELDKVMTETAVVTDFSVGDMWDQLPEYTQRANELGISTKAAYEAATLFYQQGLKTNEVVALSNETLKMARIAGLDAAVATDRMTNALRGFNMELNEMSTQRVNDVYSQLAAKSASNVDEISTAMTKVASLAHSAGMEFETTSAFLAQIIETTRESAETAGTALKTVVARFSEVKKLVNEGQLSGKDSEGEGIDVNKVQAALRTAGVDMSKFFLGEEGLDQVFLELASKWDSLTTIQQRFIATQAAGSRQQSRFIAMMQDYARTQELVQLAYDANGASAEQFAKTQESLESKLARLKNAWDEFLMGLTNSDLVKGAVDLLTNLLNGINKLTKGFDKGSSSVLKWAAALGIIGGGKALFGGKFGTAILSDVGNSFLGQLFGLGKGAKDQAGVLSVIGELGDKLRGVSSEAAAAGEVLTKAGDAAMKAGSAAAVSWAGVGTVLGVVAAVAATIGAVYLTWLNTTEEGELKQLETWATSTHNTLDEIQKTVEQQESALQGYKKYTDQLENTVFGSLERDAAIKERNQYILDLIEQDKTYAQYLNTTFDNGKMILSFDESALTSAITAGIQASRVQEYIAGMSDAAVAEQQRQIAQGRVDSLQALELNGVYEELSESAAYAKYGNNTKEFMESLGYQWNLDRGGGVYYSGYSKTGLTGAQKAELARYQLQVEQYANERDRLASATLGGLVVEGTNSNVAEGFVNSLVQSINWDSFEISFKDSVDSLVASVSRAELESQFLSKYSNMTPAQLGDLSDSDLARSIILFDKLNEVLPGVVEKFDDLVNLDPESNLGKTFRFLSGEGSSSQNWSNVTRVSDGYQLPNGMLVSFSALAKELGVSIGQVKDLVDKQIQANKLEQDYAQADVFESLLRQGINPTESTADVDYINSLTGAQSDQLAKFINNIGDNISGPLRDEILGALNKVDPGNITWLNTFFDSFDLEKPAEAFNYLNAAIESVSDDNLKQVLISLKETNSAAFDAGNMFQSFVNSADFSDIEEGLQTIVAETGRISPASLLELAGASKPLHNLLVALVGDSQNLGISLGGVATALQLVATGRVGIESVTTDILKAFSVTRDFQMVVNETKESLANWEIGGDETEGLKTYLGYLERLQKLWDSGIFFTSEAQDLAFHIFGERIDLSQEEKFFDEQLPKWQEQLSGFLASGDHEAEGFILALGKCQDALDELGLTSAEVVDGELIVHWEHLKDTGMDMDDLVDKIFDLRNSHEELQSVIPPTKEAIEAYVEALQAYVAIQDDLDENSYQKTLAKYLEEIQDRATITSGELAALGAATGRSKEQVLQDLQEMADGINNFKSQPINLEVALVDPSGKPATKKQLVDATFSEGKGNTTKVPLVIDTVDSSGNALSGETIVGNIMSGITTAGKQFVGENNPLAAVLNKCVQDATVFDDDSNAIGLDVEKLIASLAENLSISETDAEPLAEEISRQLGLSLGTNISVVGSDGSGNLSMEMQFVPILDGQSVSDLPGNIDAALKAHDYAQFAQALAGVDTTSLSDTIKTAVKDAVTTDVATAWDTALSQANFENVKNTINGALKEGASGGISAAATAQYDFSALGSNIYNTIYNNVRNATSRGMADGSASGGAAAGGVVKGGTNAPTKGSAKVMAKAAGSGTRKLAAGFALTGEEGAEIVWNKEQGYSYITGQNGAQFVNLQPGDRVFNAAETSRILANSALGIHKFFGSFAYGRRPVGGGDGDSGGSSGGADTIVAEEPVTVETSEPVNVDTSSSSSGSDYVKQSTWRNNIDWLYNLVEDISELERQQSLISEKHDLYLKSIDKNGRDLLTLTEQELSNLLTQYDNQQTMYVRRLQEMNELMIQYSQYSSYVRWNQQDQTLEIDWDRIEAIRNKETYDEIKDIISRAEAIQSKIDDAESAMSSLSASIQEIKTRYLQAYLDFQSRVMSAVVAQYQHEIDTLSELNDTLNDSNAAILESIRNEIDMQRQIRDNTDTEKAIADMEARLAYLMRDTSGANQSEILSLQKQLEDEREKYSDTLMDQAVERLEDQNEKAREQREQQIELLEQQLEFWQETGALWEEVADLMSNGFSADGALIGGSKLEQVLRDAEGWQAMSMAQRESWANELIMSTNQVGAYLLQISEGLDSLSAGIWASLPAHSYTSTKSEGGYATGGLNTRTGYAMLHGTANEPEYVLNARQTDAFMRLVDVLPSIMGGSGGSTTNYGGTMNLYFNLQVDQIANDYDVDRIADRVKDIIYDSGAYRNINVLKYAR